MARGMDVHDRGLTSKHPLDLPSGAIARDAESKTAQSLWLGVDALPPARTKSAEELLEDSMRQIPPHLLWLGHAGDGRDPRHILDVGIQAVIQVAAEEPPLALPRDLVYCRFPLVDGSDNDPNLLHLAVATVASLLEKKVPTLIVCGAGLSRSPAVAAAALSCLLSISPDDCLKRIAEHSPSDVAPALWEEIKRAVAN